MPAPTHHDTAVALVLRAGAWVGLATSLMLGQGCSVVDQVRRAAVHLHSGDAVTVTAIRGGDEIVVVKDGAEFLVRLLGVQAFDPVLADVYVQTQSQLAKQFLDPWLTKRVHVYFETSRLDPSGRLGSYVQGDADELNLQMVRDGAAPVYTEYPFGHEAAYLEVERQARVAAKGIWADPKTIFVVSNLRRVWRQARLNRHAPLLPDPLLR